MSVEQLKILIEKYLAESISPEEKRILAELLEDESNAELFRTFISDELRNRTYELEPDEKIGQPIRDFVQQKMKDPEYRPSAVETEEAPVRHLSPRRHLYWSAASVLVLVAVGFWFWTVSKKQTVTPAIIASADIPAGREGAILMLDDGTQLLLDTMKNGLIAEQNGTDIMIEDGSMAYHPGEADKGTIAFNTMFTPRGRQYQFTLPDGTKVWLNAASSIRYPTSFTGKKRTVQITGEVFFEVTRNVNKPFIVSIGKDASVEVLGTSFNIKSYDNEGDIQTTVVTGLVKVENTSPGLPPSVNKETLLEPGQQAVVIPVGERGQSSIDKNFRAITVQHDVDIDKIIAWKKGHFNFEGSSLVQVMKELERWYDIEVVYDGVPPAINFYGKMGRDLTLKDLLDALEKSKVKFVLEGRKLIVKQ